MSNVSPWQLPHGTGKRPTFHGTIGKLPKTFLVTGNPCCSRMQAKPLHQTIRLSFVESTEPLPFNSARAAPAAFPPMANGPSQFSSGVRGESHFTPSVPASPARSPRSEERRVGKEG